MRTGEVPRGRWAVAPQVVTETAPTARAGHTCALHGDVTYLFGGFDGAARLRDLHAYHHPPAHGGKGKGTWTPKATQCESPPARSSHSAVFINNQMVIFGGYDGAKSLNDLQSYDIGTDQWRELVGLGKAPSPRFGHTAVLHKETMYIFGGYDGVDRNDLYSFDFEFMQWKIINVEDGTAPPARQYHSAVAYRDEMFVFGGKNGAKHYHDLHAFNFVTQKWREVTTDSVVKPWPRAGHIAAAHGPLMFIFGGMNGKQNFNDLSVYSIDTNRWAVITVDSDPPAERRAHSAVITPDGHLCVFGGSDGAKRFDDIYSFDISAIKKHLEHSGDAVSSPSPSGEAEKSESFTPTTPPPKEWRLSRTRTETAPVKVKSAKTSTQPIEPPSEEKDQKLENPNVPSTQEKPTEASEKEDKKEIRRREREERRSRKISQDSAKDHTISRDAAAVVPASSPRGETVPTPASHPAEGEAVKPTTSVTSTPVKTETDRSGSRIALLKARFDPPGGSPTSASPSAGGSISRRSMAFPPGLAHQHLTEQEEAWRSAQRTELERVQKEMAELRSKLDERDKEIETLKARLDTRDAEMKEFADNLTKQMRKMKRDMKKLSKAKDEDAKAEKKGKKSSKNADANGKDKRP